MWIVYGIFLLACWGGGLIGHPLPMTGPCNCEISRVDGGWCPSCKMGYLAGLKVPSGLLYEALDVEGHDIALHLLRCETCKKAAAGAGYCKDCRIGFFRKKAHLTRLSFELARGTRLERAKLSCQGCREGSELCRWCVSCKSGLIGNIALLDKESFEVAKLEFGRLQEAILFIPKCESCAVACFLQTLCPICRKSFDAVDAVGKKAPP